jgi:D-amino-acid dehydrogenase
VVLLCTAGQDRGVPGRVVVVGGGIAGASAAFALARRGVGVTVVDDARTGAATAAGAGIVAPWVSTVDGPFYELYAAGAAFYPELLAALARVGVTRTDHRRTGALVVAADPAVLDEAERRIGARVRAAGAVAGEVRRLDSRGVRALFPPLAPELAGVFVSGGAHVDGRVLCAALLTGAARHGAEVVAGPALLTPSSGGAPVVTVAGRRYPGDQVVVAAGAWVDELLAPLGVSLRVRPQRGQITHLRLDGVDTGGWPSVHPEARPHYLVAFDDSRIAVGATRETGSGFDPRVTAAGQHRVLDDALRIAPGLADATLVGTRVGLRPLADGTHPVLGPLPGHPGVQVIAGLGAAGLTLAPLAGDAVARAVLDRSPPTELAAFAPRPGQR